MTVQRFDLQRYDLAPAQQNKLAVHVMLSHSSGVVSKKLRVKEHAKLRDLLDAVACCGMLWPSIQSIKLQVPLFSKEMRAMKLWLQDS